jgi:hypothetical protein
MYNYQIDRRRNDGGLDGYDMVKAANLNAALRDYLGEDYKDYTTSRSRINGKTVVAARCPAETSTYLEVSRV